MQIKIFDGDIQIIRDDGTDSGLQRKERQLVAYLLLKTLFADPLAKTAAYASPEELIEALWEKPDGVNAAHLNSSVSKAQAGLGRGEPKRIENTDAGRRLIIGSDDHTDAGAFVALSKRAAHLAPADPYAAHLLYQGALRHAGALTSLPDTQPVRDMIARVAAFRLDTVEGFGSVGLIVGDRTLPDLLGPLVEEEPTRERLRMQVMCALYSAGRTECALSVYDGYARALQAHGAVPGHLIRDVADDIRKGQLRTQPALLPEPDKTVQRYAGIMPDCAHPDRMIAYMSGIGFHTYYDRAAVETLRALFPNVLQVLVEAQQYTARLVRHLAERGIRQFLFIGAPVPGGDYDVHDVASLTAPGARIAYTFADRGVAAVAADRLKDVPNVAVARAELTHPDGIILNMKIRATIDFARPVGVIIQDEVNITPDEAKPARSIAAIMASVPKGSYCSILTATSEGMSHAVAGQIAQIYDDMPTKLKPRSISETRELFDSLEMYREIDHPCRVFTDQGAGLVGFRSLVGVGFKAE